MDRRNSVLVAALVLSGCAGGIDSASPTVEHASPSHSARSVPTATASPRDESALDLLDCDGEASPMGGRADDFGPESGGATADDAFAAWLENPVFPVPRSGYVRLGTIGDRSVYTYAVEGRVKVVAVFSPRFRELVGEPFTIEELRTCDPAEYGAGVDLGPDRRAWVHDATGDLLTDIAGPGHCGWQSARMLHLEEDGILAKQYLRDPQGLFAGSPSLLDTYAEGVDLPDDAAFSGYRTDDGLELWFTSLDTAAYVVTPEGVERWPRADPPLGCA